MDRASLIKLSAAFGTHDTGAALKLVDQIFSKGIEAKTLLGKLVDFFSNLHYFTFTNEFRVEDAEINEAQKLLKSQWSVDEIVRALDLCIKTQGMLNTSLNASLTLESMIAKLCLQRPVGQAATTLEPLMQPRSIAPTPAKAASAPAPVATPTQRSAPVAVLSQPSPSNALKQFEQFIKGNKPAWTPVLASITSLIIEDEMVKVVVRADFAGKRLSSQDGIETLKLAFKLKKAAIQMESALVSTEAKIDPKEKQMQKHTMSKEHDAVKSALSIFNATIIDTKVLEDEVPKKGV